MVRGPMEALTFRSVRRQWLIANILSLLVAAAIKLLGVGLDRALVAFFSRPLSDANWLTVEVLAVSLQYLTYSYLTALLFRRLVPAFPGSAWLTVHFILGVVIGLIFGIVGLKMGSDATIDFDDTGFLIALLIVVLLGGSLIGIAIGGVQVLVLRQSVTQGLKAWMAASAVSGVIQIAILVIDDVLSSDGTLTSPYTLRGEVGGMLAGFLSAAVMIPALRRIRP